MISIDTLIKEGSIHRFKARPEEITNVTGNAKRDLAEVMHIRDSSMDWSFAIAYNAVLQACRAYMFHLGYRPSSGEAHKATFQFMKKVTDEPMKTAIAYFDSTRIKRHRVIYDEPGLITEIEIDNLLKNTDEFIYYIETKLSEK
jgi:uncharacterized protein (UPF0332 family)